MSFGSQPRTLKPLEAPLSTDAAVAVTAQLQFQQSYTQLCPLLRAAHQLLGKSRGQRHHQGAAGGPAQLLLVLTDGSFRDYNTPAARVAMRDLRQAAVLPVCVILDNPKVSCDCFCLIHSSTGLPQSRFQNASSVYDIKTAITTGASSRPCLVPYLDILPFPYYMVVRNPESLPFVLSDALRQWFELLQSR